jgi:hypothetical protein
VENVNKAEREWRRSPLSSDKRATWKKKPVWQKKRLIIVAKNRLEIVYI